MKQLLTKLLFTSTIDTLVILLLSSVGWPAHPNIVLKWKVLDSRNHINPEQIQTVSHPRSMTFMLLDPLMKSSSHLTSQQLKKKFIEIQFMYNELHIFKLHKWISFDTGIHPWNHHSNQDNEHTHYPQSFLMPICNPSLLPLTPAQTPKLQTYCLLLCNNPQIYQLRTKEMYHLSFCVSQESWQNLLGSLCLKVSPKVVTKLLPRAVVSSYGSGRRSSASRLKWLLAGFSSSQAVETRTLVSY